MISQRCDRIKADFAQANALYLIIIPDYEQIGTVIVDKVTEGAGKGWRRSRCWRSAIIVDLKSKSTWEIFAGPVSSAFNLTRPHISFDDERPDTYYILDYNSKV